MKWFLFFFLFLIPLVAFSKDKICSGVIVHGTSDLDLSDTEKRLVCGDKKDEAYKDIPPYQASYFMTGFLQSRGYLRPRFETIEGVLHVHVGDVSKLRKIKLIFDHPSERRFIRTELKRLYLKKDLNTALIDAVEGEARSILRQRGFACSKVESVVDADSDIMTLTFTRTNVFDFGEVEREEVPGLRSNALDRYYPFKAKDKFNARLLTLNEKRMTRSEVVQGTYFLENCSTDGESFSLSQRFLVGPPRTLRFGVGANTEVGPTARVRWSNNRSGSMASTLSGEVQGSFRSQSLKLTADTFLWKDKPRRSMLSQMEITRESQIDYEQLLFKMGPVTTKWTADYGRHHWLWTLGPSYENGTYHSETDSNTKTFSTGVIEGSAQSTHHDYEFYDVHPQEGDQLRFVFGFRHPALGFSDPSLKLETSYVNLNRLTTWGRGLLLGGVRFIASTTWVSDKVRAESLPPNVKFFGGGSDDVRGFPLNTLPKNDGAGALTKFVTKWELRRTSLFHPTVEGFAFVDQGYFGAESFSIVPEMFYSPGFGVRWHSPIGIVQTYVARALSLAPTDDFGNFYYIGLGANF